MTSIVEFKDVSISVSVNSQPVDLLRKVSFSIKAGQTLGLVGESGAGKSMIGRVLSGFLPKNLTLSNGEVQFYGRKMTGVEMRKMLGKKIAFIPQEPLSSLNPVLTIKEQMYEHLARLNIAKKDREQYCIERLTEVGLPDPVGMLERYAHQLSGGQCQRVLIAMAFSGDPELIIADEPTTALDVITQAQIIRILREVQKRHNTAVILITHDLRMASHVCDEVLVLYAGDVVEYGPAARVLDDPLHPYSWALKNATPALTGPLYQLPSLAEIMPGLQDMANLTGCRFIQRCSGRSQICEQWQPILREIESGHGIKCVIDRLHVGAEQERVLHQVPTLSTRQVDPLIEFKQVDRTYVTTKNGKKSVMHALKPVSLRIQPGELVGVVGESGSGKSTIARLMVGLLEPSEGEVFVLGKPRHALTTQQKKEVAEAIQMVFQDPDSALSPRRKVWELVTQVLELDPTKTKEQRLQIANQLMQQVGIAPDAGKRFPTELSGGQKQRVNIARALCVTPRLLVADEVVSGLDVSVQALIMNLLIKLNKELGIAVVFISHDLSVIRYLCTRVLVMKNGEIVEEGTTTEVFTNPTHSYTKQLLASVPADDSNQLWPPVVEAEAVAIG